VLSEILLSDEALAAEDGGDGGQKVIEECL
jgi:hypothetical protein